jgi:hypothetical protein
MWLQIISSKIPYLQKSILKILGWAVLDTKFEAKNLVNNGSVKSKLGIEEVNFKRHGQGKAFKINKQEVME